jgi:hypothetical protein
MAQTTTEEGTMNERQYTAACKVARELGRDSVRSAPETSATIAAAIDTALGLFYGIYVEFSSAETAALYREYLDASESERVWLSI